MREDYQFMKQPIYRISILLIYVLIVTACGDAVETVSQNNLDVKRPITTASPTARSSNERFGLVITTSTRYVTTPLIVRGSG